MDKQDLIIREMKKEDLDEVWELEKASFSDPWSRRLFEESLIYPAYLFLVAEKKNTCDKEIEKEIVGYIGCSIAADECEILNVCVKSSSRREGIAKKLLDEIYYISRKNGVHAYYLEVRESNEPAIALYKKIGFVEIGKRRKYYENPVEDAILMRKREMGE